MSLTSKLTALLSPLECKSKESAEKTNCPFISGMKNALTDAFYFPYRTDGGIILSSCVFRIGRNQEHTLLGYKRIRCTLILKQMAFIIAYIFICGCFYINNLVIVESLMDCIVTSIRVLTVQVHTRKVFKIKRYQSTFPF